MTALIIDAASTDAWQWRQPLHDRCQPHLIRLAARLQDDSGTVLDQFSMLVRPLPYWAPIASEASARHRVTEGIAVTQGRTLASVMLRLDAMLHVAQCVVGHSVEYHKRVLFRAWGDINRIPAPVLPPRICTMMGSAGMVKARLQGNGWWKWPTLDEAYQYFAGAPLDLPDEPVARGAAIVDAVALIYAGMIPAAHRQERAA